MKELHTHIKASCFILFSVLYKNQSCSEVWQLSEKMFCKTENERPPFFTVQPRSVYSNREKIQNTEYFIKCVKQRKLRKDQHLQSRLFFCHVSLYIFLPLPKNFTLSEVSWSIWSPRKKKNTTAKITPFLINYSEFFIWVDSFEWANETCNSMSAVICKLKLRLSYHILTA